MSVSAKDIKESQYYVWYLGWTPCKGLVGRHFVEPGLRKLLSRINEHTNIQLIKLTVRVNRKVIKIVQEVEKSRGRIEKIRFPNIPAGDVAFACQGVDKDADIVAVIYLGFNPETQSAVHVHAYRCDSPETATVMAGHFQQIAHLPENRDRILKIENELAEKGQILPRSQGGMVNADWGNHSTGSTSSSSNPDIPSIPVFDNVAAELREKLQLRRHSPILLPPCDYDTMSRKHGHDFVELSRKLVANSQLPNVTELRKKSISSSCPAPDYPVDDSDDEVPPPAQLRSLFNNPRSQSSSQNSISSGQSGSPRNSLQLREQRTLAGREGLHKSYNESDFRRPTRGQQSNNPNFNQSFNETDFRRQRAATHNK